MRDFQQKKRWRSILESRPILIFLGILLLFFAWGVFGLLSKMRMTIENKKLAEAKLAELEKKKIVFAADVAKLSSQSGVEETIREKFPVVKEGEELIIVVDEKPKPEEGKDKKRGFFSFLFFWR